MKQFRKKMAVIVSDCAGDYRFDPGGGVCGNSNVTDDPDGSRAAASAAIGSPATFTVALDESGGPAAAACTFQWQVQKAADGAVGGYRYGRLGREDSVRHNARGDRGDERLELPVRDRQTRQPGSRPRPTRRRLP